MILATMDSPRSIMDTPRSTYGTPRSHSSGLGKKTRATSCTCCRQVKLKCDLKERYPNPCTRCTTNHQECKTDSTFKRVPARSRIRDLENQIDQLKRNRTLSAATTPRSAGELTPELAYRTPSASRLDDSLFSYAGSEVLSHGSPSGSDLSRADIKWLNVVESDPPSHFVLDEIIVSYKDALELFEHFENNYQPHFCIMEPVSSLRQLSEESEFLFWCILLVASRNNLRHGEAYFERIRAVVARMYAAFAGDAIQSLLDLQALLLLCTFPCSMPRQLGDPAWEQVGMAINSARQMGLDKDRDEIMSGTRKARHSLNRHPRYIRQMTWMKCFELDVQMSCWHGHLPSLGYPHQSRTINRFCDTLPCASGYAAIVSINAELAQSLLTLEDGIGAGGQLPSFLIRMFNERLNSFKTKWSSAWSLEAEIELLTAKLYLYTACLVSSEDIGHGRIDDEFHTEMLQASNIAAVQLSTILTNIHDESMANLRSSGFASKWWPLPGRSRHVVRSAVFAASVLLKCLDDPHAVPDDECESSRNAFTKVYSMLSNMSIATQEDYDDTSSTLEAAGRAINGYGKGRLHSHVTSRMGASIRYNVILLANEVKAQEANPDAMFEGTNLVLEGPEGVATASHVPISIPSYEHYESMYSTTNAAGQVAFNEPIWDTAAVSMPSLELGFGAWDNSAFDTWQNSLPYPASTGMHFDPLTAMTRA